MNKKQIVESLTQKFRFAVGELESIEREEIQAVTADQSEEDLKENLQEEQIRSITNQNSVVDDLKYHLEKLNGISIAKKMEKVEVGALVTLNTGLVLVSSAFPPSDIDGTSIAGISVDSPLYQKMEGLQKGAEFHLTGHSTEFIILDIE